jgi:hypothetical protein
MIKNLSASVWTCSASASEREKLVARGRLLIREMVASDANEVARKRGVPEASPYYNANILTATEYKDARVEYQKGLLGYCATKAYEAQDQSFDAMEDKQEALKALLITKNATFLELLGSVMSETYRPIPAETWDDVGGALVNITRGAIGQSKDITITPKGAMVYDAMAEGNRSVAAQTYYNSIVTMRPKKFTARGTTRLYDVIVGDADIMEIYRQLIAGQGYLISTFEWDIIGKCVADANTVPAQLQASQFSEANFRRISKLVKSVNGGAEVAWFGENDILSVAKPDASSGYASALGSEYNALGHLGRYLGYNLYELNYVVKPGTYYTTLDGVSDFVTGANAGIMFCLAMRAKKPIEMLVANDGAPYIRFEPLGDPLQEYDIYSDLYLDMKHIGSDQWGFIKGITLA